MKIFVKVYKNYNGVYYGYFSKENDYIAFTISDFFVKKYTSPSGII